MGLRLSVNGKNLTLHFLTVVGSTLHGLNTPDSDMDVKGVFTWDADVVNGLVRPEEQLDNKNMKKEDRAELMAQLNKLFDREFDDDLDLFEARKFFKNAMKSEPNMLDMLWADTVLLDDNTQSPLFFCSDKFKEVLNARRDFVILKQAKQRFLGMSFNTFKLGSKDGGRAKDLAKSVQTLFSFMHLVETGEHAPQLRQSQRDLVMMFKTAETDDALVKDVDTLRQSLEERCNELELEEKEHNFVKLNNLLLSLS